MAQAAQRIVGKRGSSSLTPGALVGDFRVERVWGFLPPLGFTKHIRANGTGVTAIAGLRLFPFRVVALHAGEVELVYVALPVRDRLRCEQEAWNGSGRLWGVEFCRFRLVRLAERGR